MCMISKVGSRDIVFPFPVGGTCSLIFIQSGESFVLPIAFEVLCTRDRVEAEAVEASHL